MKYTKIKNDYYQLCSSNGNVADISLKNISSNKFLRHYKGVLMETDFQDNDLFKYDSSFFVKKINNKYELSCSNKSFLEYRVRYDLKRNEYIISKNLNNDLVPYYFLIKNNIEGNENEFEENHRENIENTIFTPISQFFRLIIS